MSYINLAEILKYAPNGTNLYSPLLGHIKLKNIVLVDDDKNPVIVVSKEPTGEIHSFDQFGKYYGGILDSECILFPTENYRTWDLWQYYLMKEGDFIYYTPTEEQDVIPEGVYKIINIKNNFFEQSATIVDDKGQKYEDARLSFATFSPTNFVMTEPENNMIIPTELEPFAPVLVRDDTDEEWSCGLFSHTTSRGDFKYCCLNNISFKYCIPYDENTKHLLGTTNAEPDFE